ncbi:MAG: hydroxymethylglutaryl-CoA reductase [Acidobacteriota bacterium]
MRLPMIPRLARQGYAPEEVDRRRAWLEAQTGVDLAPLGRHTLDPRSFRGNVENPIGAVQVPLGVAGPLRVRGRHVDDSVYVPLATTEGALVRSYERGMRLISEAGGARVRLWRAGNRVTPAFDYDDLESVERAVETLAELEPELAAAAEATTRHGRWRGVEARPLGRRLLLEMRFATGDAQGMNMCAKAADAAASLFAEATGARRVWIMTGHGGEKRAAGGLLAGGAPAKGRRLTAAVRVPGAMLARLRVDAAQMADLWRRTVVGHLEAGTLGYNGHYANGLAALFLATGQDIANVVDSSTGITELEATPDGDLYAAVNLHSLSVATVGGGTGVGTAPTCLEMLGCRGAGKADRLAEITAAALLGGELSMAAALASGDFVAAHEAYGRNRPPEAETEAEIDGDAEPGS